MKLSRSMYHPSASTIDSLDGFTARHKTRKDQNRAVVMGYWECARKLENLVGKDVVTLPELNGWASLEIGRVLHDKPLPIRLSDFFGLTRVERNLSKGNSHIYCYVVACWNHFADYFTQHPAGDFSDFWESICRLYPAFRHPNELGKHWHSDRHLSYHAFYNYWLALNLVNEKSESVRRREHVLLGNCYFFMVEQLVAQDFLRKALTVRPFGSNPFNIAGRKVKAQVHELEFTNKDLSFDIPQFQNNELNELTNRMMTVETSSVRYHRYHHRLPFLINIAIQSHLSNETNIPKQFVQERFVNSDTIHFSIWN